MQRAFQNVHRLNSPLTSLFVHDNKWIFIHLNWCHWPLLHAVFYFLHGHNQLQCNLFSFIASIVSKPSLRTELLNFSATTKWCFGSLRSRSPHVDIKYPQGNWFAVSLLISDFLLPESNQYTRDVGRECLSFARRLPSPGLHLWYWCLDQGPVFLFFIISNTFQTCSFSQTFSSNMTFWWRISLGEMDLLLIRASQSEQPLNPTIHYFMIDANFK